MHLPLRVWDLNPFVSKPLDQRLIQLSLGEHRLGDRHPWPHRQDDRGISQRADPDDGLTGLQYFCAVLHYLTSDREHVVEIGVIRDPNRQIELPAPPMV